MLQKIVNLYYYDGLLFLGIFLLSFIFYILAKHVKGAKLSNFFFALAGMSAIGSLPVSIPMYALLLINSYWHMERQSKMVYTAYTIGRADGARNGIDDLEYIMRYSRFKDFASWRSHKLNAADMSDDYLQIAIGDEWPKPASQQAKELIVITVVILFIFLIFYCSGGGGGVDI